MRTALITIASSIALAMMWWLTGKARDGNDRRLVRGWLKANTKDEPHESHVDTVTLAKGVRLPEDRVRRACMSDKRVHRASGDSDLWSVWRAEPQSVYEKRGPIVF